MARAYAMASHVNLPRSERSVPSTIRCVNRGPLNGTKDARVLHPVFGFWLRGGLGDHGAWCRAHMLEQEKDQDGSDREYD
jgi:hypothetical protein